MIKTIITVVDEAAPKTVYKEKTIDAGKRSKALIEVTVLSQCHRDKSRAKRSPFFT